MIERNLEGLIEGLIRLNQEFIIDHAAHEMKIEFGFDAFVAIDTETLEVIDYIDVQEWAQTIEGIFNQIDKKLEGAKK